MYIKREFEALFAKTIRSRSVLVVYGSRQTGKTTVIEKVLEAEDIKNGGVVTLNGDIKAHRDMLSYESMTPERAHLIIGNAKTLSSTKRRRFLTLDSR